jgi:universal stress protein A
MFEILPVNDKDILAFKASGKLTDADYKQFLPVLETMIRKAGQLSLYVELQDFEGWEAKAAWDDLHFGLHHDNDFKRIAIVADKPLIHAATGFINFFSHIEMRFFESSESEAAWDWLRERPAASEPERSIQPYKNILLPTDFSAHSDIAAKRALQIAEQNSAQLHVLHAIEEVMYYNEAYDPVIAEIPLPDDDVLMTQAVAQMQKFCERNNLGEAAVIETQWGNPKWSIITWADEKNTDLIVMGSHGRHGLGRLLGSVSNSVLHKAHCDVLIVKP